MISSSTLDCGCSVSRVFSEDYNRVLFCYEHMEKFQKEDWYKAFIKRSMVELGFKVD